jgi:hypothetical protein
MREQSRTLLRRRKDAVGPAGAFLEQPGGVSKQRSERDKRHGPADSRGSPERGICDCTERDGDRAAAHNEQLADVLA